MNFETVLTYAVLLLFVILVAIVYNGIEEYNRKNETKMSFMESMDLTGIPVVTFINNGKKFNFLLDTGANYSVINSSTLNDIKYTSSSMTSKLFGMEGNAQEVNFATINLEYKNNKFTDDFQVVDMGAAFDKVKQSSGVTVCGILGSEFFRKYKYILDFNNLIAYIKK